MFLADSIVRGDLLCPTASLLAIGQSQSERLVKSPDPFADGFRTRLRQIGWQGMRGLPLLPPEQTATTRQFEDAAMRAIGVQGHGRCRARRSVEDVRWSSTIPFAGHGLAQGIRKRADDAPA